MTETDGPHAARYDAILADPRYQRLVQRRGRFTWLLTILMLAVYFGYILLIAFDKAALARPIGSGFTSIGIPIGIGVILFAILADRPLRPARQPGIRSAGPRAPGRGRGMRLRRGRISRLS